MSFILLRSRFGMSSIKRTLKTKTSCRLTGYQESGFHSCSWLEYTKKGGVTSGSYVFGIVFPIPLRVEGVDACNVNVYQGCNACFFILDPRNVHPVFWLNCSLIRWSTSRRTLKPFLTTSLFSSLPISGMCKPSGRSPPPRFGRSWKSSSPFLRQIRKMQSQTRKPPSRFRRTIRILRRMRMRNPLQLQHPQKQPKKTLNPRSPIASWAWRETSSTAVA